MSHSDESFGEDVSGGSDQFSSVSTMGRIEMRAKHAYHNDVKKIAI
jgi:hypothetical protein